MLKQIILDFVSREKQISGSPEYRASCALPENCYLLGDGVMLCYPRTTGDSRYPYTRDGFTLWAHSSGNMSLNESTFYCILPADDGKQPYISFFGGKKNGNEYIPVSITGAAKSRDKAKRFTVYTPTAVYYITEIDEVVYFLRAFMSAEKKAVFSVGAVNLGKKPLDTYLSSYFNCLCMHAAGESVETKWFKQCTVTDCGFCYDSVENVTRTKKIFDYCVINRAVNANVSYCEHTSSRSDYVGGATNALTCAEPLYTGHFAKQKQICKFGDTAAVGDIYAIKIDGGEIAVIDYVIDVMFDKAAQQAAIKPLSLDYADGAHRVLLAEQAEKSNGSTTLDIDFGTFDDGPLNGKTFTGFIKNVITQTEFGALAKNSGVSLLGVRDLVQQLEAALIWTPEKCRAKFLEMFGFIDPSGRPPRQYSLPADGALPQMDTRAFIDQGVWIISALYTYLAYTDDASILDEVCGYYKIVGDNTVESVEEKNSVYEHIARIANYLIDNIDPSTDCLRALYGDWNDALDGLGVSQDKSKRYGSGVSVMATLQLYGNTVQLLEIIEKYGDRFGLKQKVADAKIRLERGLKKNAIVEKDGKRKILHGWGDKRSYLVGSYSDSDGKSRDGLTASAFWVISGAYLWDKSIKADILSTFSRLDSKYGLKTFEPYFAPDTPGVGRIVDLPKGTAENAAVYVHATLFGVWALFMMGEGKAAWEQLYKVLPITHKLITTTPFVMSNSYSYNEELGLDGESMSDWFTGSANTFIKAIVRYVFGVEPDLDGVKISPCEYMPTKFAQISITVKGKRIKLVYRNKGAGKRSFTLNGAPVTATVSPSSGAPMLYIRSDLLKSDNTVTVTD